MKALPIALLVALGLFVAQQQVALQPGDSILVTCAGRLINVSQTDTELGADCAEILPPPTNLRIVRHTDVSVAAFEAVPRPPVEALRTLFYDRSVGANLSDGLTVCLAVDAAASPSVCRRWGTTHYAVPPQSWTAHPLPGWHFFGHSGITPDLPCPDSSTLLRCFESYVDAHASEYDVVALGGSYLEAGTYQLPVTDYLATMDRIQANHPAITVVYMTSSLARIIGDSVKQAYNGAVRAHAAAHDLWLFDFADIESHNPPDAIDDPDVTDDAPNAPVFYQGFEAISPFYTSEVNGGHLGSVSTGKIRMAMAWWILLGRLVG